MILKSLHMRNIRSHTDTRIDLNKGMIVFTGRTGSGKSTVIMAVQYALFGSNARIPNAELLRRRTKSGYVSLEFSHKGHQYKIVRGLKTQGEKIMVDTSNLSLFKDGDRIPILERASDLDEKILDILGYPSGVDPVKLFEVTTYSKQDEIRNLIEMKPKERQEYIDKLLQIQRYENTWENLKDVVNGFNSEIMVMEERVSSEELLAEQLRDSKEKMKELKVKMDSSNKKLSSDRKKLETLRNELLNEKERFEKILRTKSEFDAAKSRFESSSEEMSKLDLEITALKRKIKDHESRIPKVSDTESLIKRRTEIESKITHENQKIAEFSAKLRDVGELKGKCPLCGSKVTGEHKSEVEKEYKNIISESQGVVIDLGDELEKVDEILPSAKRRDEMMKSLESDKKFLNEKQSRIKNMKDELLKLESVINRTKHDVEKFTSLKKRIDELQENESKLSSRVSSLDTEVKAYGNQINEEEARRDGLKKQISDFEIIKDHLKAKKSAVELLSKLRQDIRNIRERVRIRFLSDLKVEFQRKFEEIRRFEEEYSVDVKVDYEPVAYAGGDEVTISTLSGGEKTSVALSYRLAIADIAAQIGGIQESELLMLDEPTTGFDEEDIKALPEALANLRTIPQILIVTHAEELKETADYKFEVKKEGNISKVKLLEM